MIQKCLQVNADRNRAHGRLVHNHFCLFLESPGPPISDAYQFDLKVFSLSHIAVTNGRQTWQSLYLDAEQERWQQPQEETSDRLFRSREEAPLFPPPPLKPGPLEQGSQGLPWSQPSVQEEGRCSGAQYHLWQSGSYHCHSDSTTHPKCFSLSILL